MVIPPSWTEFLSNGGNIPYFDHGNAWWFWSSIYVAYSVSATYPCHDSFWCSRSYYTATCRSVSLHWCVMFVMWRLPEMVVPPVIIQNHPFLGLAFSILNQLFRDPPSIEIPMYSSLVSRYTTGRCWRRYRWYKIELFPRRKHSGEGGTFSV